MVENDQVDTALNLLKDEELIQGNDIDYNYGKVKIYSLIATAVLIFILIQFLPTVLFDFLPVEISKRCSSQIYMHTGPNDRD